MSSRAVDSVTTLDALSAFAVAGDLGRGLPSGHVFRTTVLAMHVGRSLGLDPSSMTNLFYTGLLLHAGCTAAMPQFAAFVASDDLVAQRELCLCDPSSMRDMFGWMRRNVAPGASLPTRVSKVLNLMMHEADFSTEIDGGCSDVGSRIAKQLGMPQPVQDALFHICEIWSGKGPHGLKGQAIPLATRIVNASMVVEVLVATKGIDDVRPTIVSRRGKSIEPDVGDALVSVLGDGEVRSQLAAEDTWPIVQSLQPSADTSAGIPIDAVCEAFADFIDLKLSGGASHSRKVAALAEDIARRLELAADRILLTKRAALVHDVGLVAVPTLLLDKATPFSSAERERYESHTYFTEHVLARVSALREVAAVASAHHERADGQGYPHGLPGSSIPAEARAIAVADAFDELTRQRPRAHALSPSQALEAFRSRIPGAFDPQCIDALAEAVSSARQRRDAQLPAGLTEREAEVLRLIASGERIKTVAERLVISESTARHHLEHVYEKLGVTSRAGATLFAAQNGLVAQVREE